MPDISYKKTTMPDILYKKTIVPDISCRKAVAPDIYIYISYRKAILISHTERRQII